MKGEIIMLTWDWSKKCGELTATQKREDGTEKDFVLSMYEGNAFLIVLHEFVDDEGTERADLWSFWADEAHAKNCLGLNKKGGFTENIYCKPWEWVSAVRINKKMHTRYEKLVSLLVRAFDNIKIEVYAE